MGGWGWGCGENGALQSAVIRRTCLRPVDYKLLQAGLDLQVLRFASLEYSYKSYLIYLTILLFKARMKHHANQRQFI